MIALKRDLQIEDFTYDDVMFVCTVLYSIYKGTGVSHRELVRRLSDDKIHLLLETACVVHCLPYEQTVIETAMDFFNLSVGDFGIFTEAWNCSGIFSRLITRKALESKELGSNRSFVQVFRDVYTSELGDLLVDTSTAWPIVQSNALLEESVQFIGY